jgi:predicted RNA-binding protein with PUA-like domain
MQYWLLKSEPYKYSWENLEQDGKTFWDGVRNFQARNNLKAMKQGDYALFYHSNEGKEIVGIAKIIGEAYQDPTTEDANWVAVDVAPVSKLKQPVSLETIKSHPVLQNMALVKQSRLSVCPVTKQEFEVICQLGGVNLL